MLYNVLCAQTSDDNPKGHFEIIASDVPFMYVRGLFDAVPEMYRDKNVFRTPDDSKGHYRKYKVEVSDLGVLNGHN